MKFYNFVPSYLYTYYLGYSYTISPCFNLCYITFCNETELQKIEPF